MMIPYSCATNITADMLNNHSDGDNTSLALSRFVDMVG